MGLGALILHPIWIRPIAIPTDHPFVTGPRHPQPFPSAAFFRSFAAIVCFATAILWPRRGGHFLGASDSTISFMPPRKFSDNPLYHLCIPLYTTCASCDDIQLISTVEYFCTGLFWNSDIGWYDPRKRSLALGLGKIPDTHYPYPLHEPEVPDPKFG
jgi:hypothetical protein